MSAAGWWAPGRAPRSARLSAARSAPRPVRTARVRVMPTRTAAMFTDAAGYGRITTAGASGGRDTAHGTNGPVIEAPPRRRDPNPGGATKKWAGGRLGPFSARSEPAINTPCGFRHSIGRGHLRNTAGAVIPLG